MKQFFLFLILVVVASKSYSISVLDKSYRGENKSYANILKKINPEIIASRDSISIEEHLKPIAEEIVAYSKEVYNQDLSQINTQGVILSALTLLPFEERDRLIAGGMEQEEAKAAAGEVCSCMMAGIGSVVGIAGMVRDVAAMWNSGASVSSVFTVVKRIFRQYFGWFAVAWAVYEFGDCMNWW